MPRCPVVLAIGMQDYANGVRLNDSTLSFLNDRQQLLIDEAQASDAGRYTCLAENKPGRAEKDLIVAILQPPVVPGYLSTREVQQGGQLILECPIQDSTVEYTWTKNGIPVTTSDRLQHSVSRDKLYVVNADQSDSAQYVCIAKNNAGEAKAPFDAIVNEAPKIAGPSFKSQDVILGQTLQLNCEATGTPQPTLSWLLDGRPLIMTDNIETLEGGRSLVITGIQANQDGRFTCKAENKAGKTESDTYIQVISPPRVSMQSEEIKVVAGRGATIRCEVFGNPTPQVEWLKNGQIFKSDLVQSTTNLEYLHLREAKVEDSAKYTCIATNRAGEQRANTQLQVLVIPVIEDGERVIQVKESNDLNIDCTSSGIPTPTIAWKRDGHLLEGVEGARLSIPSANISHAGRYTCIATNEAGRATADFAVDVFSKPRFKETNTDIKVLDGERARLECKAEGHPTPTIRWFKGGRPIEDFSNMILSPRGETLLILKTRRIDAGSYSCLAKNLAGESQADYMVSVLTMPYIDEALDQNPRIVQGKTLLFHCPVMGNPPPTVEWKKDNVTMSPDSRVKIIDGQDLQIEDATKADEGRYTCVATNDAGVLTTDYKPEVIAPPKFQLTGDLIIEAVETTTAVLNCNVDTQPKPEITWSRAGDALYLSKNMALSSDGTQLTIKNVNITDQGKYTCQASNEAGTSNIDLLLKVYVPPRIDTSNIVGSPLGIMGRKIYLECPILIGIPHPSVTWTKDGKPIDLSDSRLILAQNNQTFGIEGITAADQARYTCNATNKGGSHVLDFQLEVLSPPSLETLETQEFTKREGDPLSLTCPVKPMLDANTPISDVSWTKDGKPIDPKNPGNFLISPDGRRLTHPNATMAEAGVYTCVASNRAGETDLDFRVSILSPPTIDTSKDEQTSTVVEGRPLVLKCTVSGHPFPTITWVRNGQPVTASDEISFIDGGQQIEIHTANRSHAGAWTCSAENDAGVKEVEYLLDVYTAPSVQVTSENPIKNLQETVTLFCNATGNPYPTLNWTKAGLSIVHSVEGMRISNKGARLDIPHLSRDDVGDYTCRAVNPAGSADASIHVDVLVPPVINRDKVEMSPTLPTGQSLKLFCKAEGKPPPAYTWYVNDTEITTSTEGITLGKNNEHILINNITLQDHGHYKCVVNNVAGSDTLDYDVNVVQAPIISNGGGSHRVIEGELAKIECLAEGHPPPQISWLRNGMFVETGVQGVRYIAEGKFLMVMEARSSDSGIYVCSATNEAGTSQQAYTLDVLVAPKIATNQSMEQHVVAGAPFSLKCRVTKSYPDPTISWTLNEEPLEEGFRGHTIGPDGTLSVEAATDRMAIYRCIAKNDAGSDNIEYTVHTISAPSVTKDGDVNLNATQGDPAELICNIDGDDSKIVWQKNGMNLLPTGTISFTEDLKQVRIQSVTLSDEGVYTCTASNSAGNATQKIKLYIGVPPRIVNENDSTKVAVAGETATLWCEVGGVPTPAINWYKDDKLITNTAVDSEGSSPKKSIVFGTVEQDHAGIYTCKAENWAGLVTKDFSLIVLTKPQVHPAEEEVTGNLRDKAILTCNATGNPEPIITWRRMPGDEPLQLSEKYQFLGTSLAVRNLLPEDEGYYHCIAKSDAGHFLAKRRLTLNKPKVKKTVWNYCDENNRPLKEAYIVPRGDVPDDDPTLLHWNNSEDHTVIENEDTIIHCILAHRTSRKVGLHLAPRIVVFPRDNKVPSGSVVEFSCSAIGPPTPRILWAKDDTPITDKERESGTSKLVIHVRDDNDTGTFTCVAMNSVGLITASAKIEIDESLPVPPTPSKSLRNIAVLTCIEKGHPINRGVTWEYHDQPVGQLAGMHQMNNGTLVLLDTHPQAEELKQYKCKSRNRRRQNTVDLMQVEDEAPVVETTPDKVDGALEKSVTLKCKIQKGNPLTTQIVWTRNDQKIVPDEVTHILPNNSLFINSVEEFDKGMYKCVAANALGKAYDTTELVVEDGSGQAADEEGEPARLQSSTTPETSTTSTSTTTTTTVPPTTTTTPAPTTTSSSTTTTTTTPPTTRPKPTETVLTVDILSSHSSQLPVDYDGGEGSGEEDGPISVCSEGYESINGVCVAVEPHDVKAVTNDHNRCPEGYVFVNGVCEDFDECSFDHPCEYECVNILGSFDCNCPEGYELIHGDCMDIDECPTIMCNDSLVCFNKLGSYDCIEDPCPANYSIEDGRLCVPDCIECDDPPIQLQMLAVPGGLPAGTPLARLTAYDKTSRVLHNTHYSISTTEAGLALRKQRSGPFSIREERGHATVATNKVLPSGAKHRIRVRAESDGRHSHRETHFLLLVDVGRYPF